MLFNSMGKDANWLSWFENQFSDIAGEDRQIDFEEFKKALQLSKVPHILVAI